MRNRLATVCAVIALYGPIFMSQPYYATAPDRERATRVLPPVARGAGRRFVDVRRPLTYASHMARKLLTVRGVLRRYPEAPSDLYHRRYGSPTETEVHWYWGIYDPKTNARIGAGPITGGDLPEMIPDTRPATLRALRAKATRVARDLLADGSFREYGRSFQLAVSLVHDTA